MNLSELRVALTEAKVRPVKSLGQNFLHDENLARWIVAQADIQANDFVVEIGPGLGALTREIIARGARVLALEKDARLVEYLQRHLAGPRVEVMHVDALRFDPRLLFAHRSVKIVGNLPYYVASQLLLHFIDFPSRITLAVLMLQDEMARRLAATHRDRDYGAFSLRLQLHFQIEYLRKIRSSVFFPRPDVASAMIRVIPRDEREIGIHDVMLFREIVRQAFSQRRKQLGNALGDHVPDWEAVTAELNISRAARAEALSRERWIALANFLAEACEKETPPEDDELFAVVDADDRETGSASRRKVHENNLLHRAVHILLFNAAGEILLQKRSGLKDRHPNAWDSSAAGHVDAGEDYDLTAARELMEELGIQTPLKRLGKIPASDRTGQEFIRVYTGRHDGPFEFNRREIAAVMFFPIRIVESWMANAPEDFAPGFLECWKLWRESVNADRPKPAAAASSSPT